MRLHFKKVVETLDVFKDLPHQKVGAITLRAKPTVDVLIDMYNDATPQQIQNVIDKAKTKDMLLVRKEPGTFVVHA